MMQSKKQRALYRLVVLVIVAFGFWLIYKAVSPLWQDSLIREEHISAAEEYQRQLKEAEPERTNSAVVEVSDEAEFDLDQAEADAEPEPTVELVKGEAFGVMVAPRLGKDFKATILEGVGDDEELAEGVGHYPSTQGPCEVGNFALAGHRTTHGALFEDIDQLKPGDVIQIQAEGVECSYEVYDSIIVRPDQNDVLAPVPMKLGQEPDKAVLTLTACHPKYSTAERYIVFAERVD